jgi:signal transduction histidine kinase
MSRHEGIAGWALNNTQAVIVDDTLKDGRFNAQIGESVDYATTSMICVPLVYRSKAVGVLQVLNKRSGEGFDDSDKELLIALAAQSAIAIHNAQLYQDLREEQDRLVAIEEDVRRRLARQLHDGPTQLVAAITMNLQYIRKLLDRDPSRADCELEEMIHMAGQAMRQLRTMLFDLRPVILETKGLLPALKAYSSRLSATERFAVHLNVEGEMPRLSKQAESAIFAVVQEAIGNARKHAQADNAWITVQRQGDSLQVAVRDDGLGCNVEEILAGYESRGSLGLLHMRESAERIEGSFSMESTVGQGTIVHLSAPLLSNLVAHDQSQGDSSAKL